MPDRIYSVQYNGRIYDVRAADTASPDEIFSYVRQQAGGGESPQGKENAGFLGSLSEAVTQVPKIANEVAAYGANPNEANRRALIKAGESEYKHVGGFGEGDNWEYFKELAGGSLGQLVAPVAAGLAATPLTSPLGGLITAGAVSDAQYTAQNLLRQAQEQERAIAEGRKPEETSVGKALLAGTGQAALDVAGGAAFGTLAKAFPFMEPLLGKLGGNAAKEAGEVLEDAVSKGTLSFAGGVARGFGKGVAVEVPQEVAQQALERWQAGLGVNPFHNKDARDEYTQAAIGALVLGGPIGAFEGAISRNKPYKAPTEEEQAAGTSAAEQAIADIGIPETQDPEIRARAAAIMQNGIDPETAVAQAIDERDELQARLKRAEELNVTEPDVGGGEPSVPISDVPEAGVGLAGEPTEAGNRGVGTTGVPAGQADVGEGKGAAPLAPNVAAPISVVPPMDQVSPEAQFAEQLAPVATPKVAPAPAPAVEEAAPVKEAAPVEEAAPVQKAPIETNLEQYGQITQQGQVAPPELVNSIASDILERVNANNLDEVMSGPQGVWAQQFFANEAATINDLATQKAAEEAPPTVAETATVEKTAPPVAEINPALPEDVQALQAEVNQYNPGFEIRYSAENNRRRYSYGLPGAKNIFASPNLNSVRNRVLNEKPVQPKQVVEGVPVKQLPAGEARGLKKPVRQMQLQPEKPSVAGKLTPAQEQQQELLLFEIDEARKARQISNAERTELVDMLRTPQGKELAKSREWTLATAIQSDIDKLTEEGRKLRAEEKLAEKQNNLTPAKRREFKERAEEIATRTKAQSAELAKVKSGIYQRTREKLAERKSTRQDTINTLREEYQNRVAQLERNLKKKFIDENTYKVKLAEAQRKLKQGLSAARPEPVMFRKAKGKAAGITLEELNAAVKDITDRWSARIEPKMVQSIADLPASIRSEIEELGRTDAFGFYKDGKAYLIADNMNGVQDVAPTLYHEALGHLGLRERFREGLDAILTDIHRTNKNVAALADKWLNANQDLYAEDENPVARAVEEVLASASETGPLRASRFDKLVKFIKDFARQYLGLDFKFSDREVRTILAMAHEQALSGEGTVMGSSSTMFNSPEQDDADEEVATVTTSAQDAIDKIATTTNDRVDPELYARGVMGSISEGFKARNIKNLLKSMTPTSFSRGFIGRGGLNFMPTDGMLNYFVTKFGDNITTREARAANEAMVKMNSNRASMRRVLSKTARDLKQYLNETGDNSLPLSMDYGSYYNMDMAKFTKDMTLEEGYKTDSIWRRYNTLLQKTDLDAAERKDYEGKLQNRQYQIEGGMKVWSKLSKEGRRLYERVRDTHREMYKTRQFLMKQYLKSLKDAGMSEEAVGKLMLAYRQQQEKLNEVEKAPAAEDAHKEFPEVPLGLFHKEYFPKRRYGNYWLRIKKSKFGEPILRFYESMDERDADWEAAAAELGVNKTDPTYFKLGNNVKVELQDLEGVNTNTAFNKALSLISDIDPKNFTEAKRAQLQNDVYQLFLMGTPEGSGRKQFIKSKNRLGWSSDILRTFGATAEDYASDIARLRFGPQVDRALDSAYKSVEPQPGTESIPADQAALARDFITNLKERIQGSMEPQTESLVNKIVPWMNSWAYLSFLTAPATAIIQPIALGLNVAPHLASRYGLGASTKAMGRYMNVFNNRPKLEGKETEGRKSFKMLTLLESNKVKNSKRHRDALLSATHDYGIIMPISEFTMYDERTPKTAVQGQGQEVLQKSYDVMTYLFDTTEQLSREVTFMAAYDLEYDKLASTGLPAEERQKRAIASATEVVNSRLGDYSALNRAPIMKGSQLARAVFLFKQYAVTMTKFFVESARSIFGPIFGGKTSRADQVAAMKEVTGVLSMGFLIGGLKGMPLYSLGMMALQALQDAFDTDDDRKERMKKNPITADSVELQFKYEWLPSHFGQQMITDDKGKKIPLSDILLNGAVSEATGWNFGSRVSLDLANMWFRAPKEGNNWADTVNNALVENISGASATLDVVKMGEEVSKGNVASALEHGMPAFIKSLAKSYNLSSEGVRTTTGKIKLSKDELSNAEIVGAALGFNPIQIAKTQEHTRDILNRTKKLQEQKSELLGAYKEAVRRIQNGDADGQEKAREAFKAIMDYNKKVGNPYFGISYSNIYKSLTGAASEEKYDINGMGLNQTESYYAEKTLGKQ